ncbi:MAG TPA: ABC transporter permease [Candidatus Limnocylindrales bacterium]|nr:ABC transporter permease [Candidatus Limnocylindrales bacterium]
MEALIETLYAIPLLGLAFQLVGYLVAVVPSISPIILQAATPIAFAALCGVICERSGVVNIGIEGVMLTAAFVGWYAGVLVVPMFGPGEPGVLGITPALLVAFAAALASGLVVSALHAWLSISVKADQIISGTIINIAAFGITGYLNTLIASGSPNGAGAFTQLSPPRELRDLPVIGWLIDMFLSQGPITLSLVVVVVVFQLLLFRSRWGLRTRAVGEHPRAAETVGIDVIRVRYRNVILGGLLAAMGGAFLSLEGTNSFQAGMTAGRGFIGLAAMIVGRWSPLGAFGAALLFSSTQAIGQSIGFFPPTGQLGEILGALPGQAYDAIPYFVTIVVLAGVVGRSIPPAAVGQPYEREAVS